MNAECTRSQAVRSGDGGDGSTRAEHNSASLLQQVRTIRTLLSSARLSLVLISMSIAVSNPVSAADTDSTARIDRILTVTPLVDGHNDLPAEIRARFKSKLAAIDLLKDTSSLPAPAGVPPLMTDIPRLRAGHVGAQFWSVWVSVQLNGPEAVQTTLEQIDLVKEMAHWYPKDLEMAYRAADIRRIHKAGRIASLIGIEGGHQINNSMSVLRQMYALGARYMTLTHTSNTDWADSATDTPRHHGLTPFGREIVREMNRLGMLVDLSHVSPDTMRAALATSAAPVIFSHSSARALVDHPRDVPDDILKLVAQNGGIVMVNFAPLYVSQARNVWFAEYAATLARFSTPPYGGVYIGQPDRASAAMTVWQKEHPMPEVTLAQVADHIEHIRQVAGIDHVGLGSDFDGIPDSPVGLEAVDRYPALLAELVRRGWQDTDITKLAGENLLRVMSAAEAESLHLQKERFGSTATLAQLDAPTAP
jgi:membrane dipeptidase